MSLTLNDGTNPSETDGRPGDNVGPINAPR